VFLDQNLKVGRFTAGASRLYQLLPGDVGRPLTDITTTLGYGELPEDAREVLRTLIPMEKTVTTRDGRWFSVRVMPYRTQDNRIDGLVLTFTETTTAKLLERDLRATAGQFQALLDHLTAGYVLCAAIPRPDGQALDGRVLQANRAFAQMLPAGAPPEGRTLLELLPDLEPVLGAALAGTKPTGEPHVFEQYLKVGAASFEVISYRPAPDQFVCTFRESTESGRLFETSGGGSCHETP
jgi:two-component system CheB/CheR fusion protein